MGLPTARTTELIDKLAALTPRLRAQLAADGVLCETDRMILETVRDAKHDVMVIDEGQLNAVSYLRTGYLNNHRHTRMERLAEQIEDERAQPLGPGT